MKQTFASYLPLVAIALFVVSGATGQNVDISLYDHFDNAIEKKNLGINNGTIHLNTLRSANDSHRYYSADQYVLGDIIYDGQPYAKRSLKYDVLNDIIIAKAEGENNTLGTNLISAKTATFSIYGKKFVNLSYNNIAPKFVTGFYEEEPINNQMTFYTKYRKDKIEVLRTEGVFYKFEDTQEFVFRYKANYYRLASKSDAVHAFPQLEKDIETFYRKNTALENSGKKLFFTTLLSNLATLLPTDTNLPQ